ncbi:hypothetical protein PLUTE_b0984 [Pseudoalteromonas luteoviolacea DSM 6061]|nr:hypothetical protein [Pseudoalteromonas luteoviolacea DSM 6061]
MNPYSIYKEKTIRLIYLKQTQTYNFKACTINSLNADLNKTS